MLKKLTATALTVLLLAMPTQAWNNKGHATVAYIAYMNLDPAVKKKVNRLLERHPDFLKLTDFAGSPTSSSYRLIIFMNAATWPDSIREDPRFYDETDPDSVPTPKLPGFPSMKKFKPFHYIDLPYRAEDDVTVTGPYSINALKTLRAFRSSLNKSAVPPNIQAYNLAWLLHVAGDVHQPLHCISRFTKELSPPEFPDGDRGGNEFKITPFPVPEADYKADNLHSFWDGVLGVRRDLASIRTLAISIMNEHPKPNSISTDEQSWINESFERRKFVYSITPNSAVPAAYFTDAQKLARARVAIAGYRIAEVLNERFKD